MQADRNAKCSDRLPAHLAGRVRDFTDFGVLFDAYDDDPSDEARAAADRLDIPADEPYLHEAAYDRVSEYPLAISTLRVHRIDLSTGGPADWLEVFVDPDDSRINRIVYHFADWFDHADQTLEGADFDAAERFVSALIPEL